MSAFEDAGASPFRLTAKFETFDYLGQPATSGTVEELFLKPGFRKRDVKRVGGSERFAPEDQVAQIDDAVAAGNYMEALLFAMQFSPGPPPESVRDGKIEAKQRTVAGIQLNCIALTPAPVAGKPKPQKQEPVSYCLSDTPPRLRVTLERNGFIVVYNRFLSIGEHVAPGDVQIVQRGRTRAKLTVTSLKAEPGLSELDVPKVDVGTSGEPEMGQPGSKVQAPVLVYQPNPVFPENSKAKHISGEVIVSMRVGRNGLPESLDVVTAPADDLAEAALDAVRQYRFRAATRDGQPVSVDMNVSVNFKLF